MEQTLGSDATYATDHITHKIVMIRKQSTVYMVKKKEKLSYLKIENELRNI